MSRWSESGASSSSIDSTEDEADKSHLHYPRALSEEQESPGTSSSDQACHIEVSRNTLNKYMHVFNASILHTKTDQGSLDGSSIGSSYWSPLEKERFFSSLQRHGIHALSNIAQDVVTKSRPEVRQYVLHLHHAAAEYENDSRERRALYAAPPSSELSHDLTTSFDELAVLIEQNMHDQLCDAERNLYGHEHWIVDEHDLQEDEDADLDEDTDLEEHDSDGSTPKTRAAADAAQSTMTSYDLLRPAMLIKLMRDLFMNSNASGGVDRWDQLPVRTIDSEGPSVLRSALEELYQIVISLTRRLVQAVIFQTTARLRADRDERIVPVVRTIDVLAVLDVLNIEHKLRPEFWHKSLKTKQVKVLSRSKRLRPASQPVPKHGFVLTSTELEDRLIGGAKQESDDESDAGSMSSATEEESIFKVSDEDSSADGSPDDTTVQDTYPASDILDDMEDDQAEEETLDEYWQAQDAVQSVREENTLRHHFNLPQLVAVKPKQPRNFSDYAELPALWLDDYTASWEQPGQRPRKRSVNTQSDTTLPRPPVKRRNLSSKGLVSSSDTDESQIDETKHDDPFP